MLFESKERTRTVPKKPGEVDTIFDDPLLVFCKECLEADH